KTSRATIHWYAPKGPVSPAMLGLDARGDLVLFEWNGKAIKVQVAHDGAGPVSQCTILGRRFRRVREGGYTRHCQATARAAIREWSRIDMPADQPDGQCRGSSVSTRREFLKASAVAGGALVAANDRAEAQPSDVRRRAPRAGGTLSMLVLGGTGFIGPHLVRH